MKSNILVVLSALSVALSAPIATPLQTPNLKQVVGPRSGTTSDQPWQVSAAGNWPRTEATFSIRSNSNGNTNNKARDLPSDQPPSDQPPADTQTVGDGSLQLAELPILPAYRVFSPNSGLARGQIQYINTMLNKFGPGGPQTMKEAVKVFDFAKGVAGRDALTPEEVKEAMQSLLNNEWIGNAFKQVMSWWVGGPRGDLPAEDQPDGVVLNGRSSSSNSNRNANNKARDLPSDQRPADTQTVADRSIDNVQLAELPAPIFRVFSPNGALTLEQIQYINTMLNEFGPGGPQTLKGAFEVFDFAKGFPEQNSLTLDEVKDAMESLLNTEWLDNFWKQIISTWLEKLRSDLPAEDQPDGVILNGRSNNN